jgi:tRNA threonylcarbamoyladenosine biosynthesis protein TsaB
MAAAKSVLIAVETTSVTGSLSIAEIEDKRISILATERWQKKASHSEVITAELLRALDAAKLDLSALTHLCVDVGPGSFTGIRVGLNLVRSLAYSLGLPTQTFTSLEVFAHQSLSPGENAIVALPAVQTFFYVGAMSRQRAGVSALAPLQSLDQDGIERLRVSTNVQKLLFPNEEPKSETLVQLFAEHFKKSNFLTWKDVLPLYIRASEAEEKLRKGLLKPIA